ncbi:MAG: hypothetical protein CM15mP44_3890 [Candidatus Neomarinimicrobiota bacterium]|nr:MAG: hypothetical protein CM15mP44_3890 [Candidatus Neomarinimicrobiota bacterium]
MNTNNLSANSDVIKDLKVVNYSEYKINKNLPDRIFKKRRTD